MKFRSGVAFGVAVACWAAWAGRADAQESWSLSSPGGRVELSRESNGMQASVGVYGRWSLLGGTVDPDVPAHYDDLFKSGIGVVVEGTLLWKVGPKWQIGPYLSVGWDGYDGKGDTDDVGDTLKPDKLDITTFLVGVRGRLDLGNHFSWDAHLGLGAAHSSAVDGQFISGGIGTDVSVFKASTVFAFDLGTRFAYDAGPVFVDVGIGFRTQGAPGNADFDFNSGPIVSFALEFGVGVRF